MSLNISKILWCCAIEMLCSVLFAEQEHYSIYKTNAHEGPVCVLLQNRIYFTSKPNHKKNINSVIKYLDLNTGKSYTFSQNVSNPNSMFLAKDGYSLVVAEQGALNSKGKISLINTETKDKKILVDSYKNLPFNSPNKVIVSKSGVIYFSDPDFGFLQGFKKSPKLPNAIYAYNPKSKILTQLSTQFSLPHGLALSPDQKILYVGDTAAAGVQPINYQLSHEIDAATLDVDDHIKTIRPFKIIPGGLPDGFITDGKGNIYVATSKGVQVYSNKGKLIRNINLNKSAYNLTLCASKLFVTTDGAIFEIKLS